MASWLATVVGCCEVAVVAVVVAVDAIVVAAVDAVDAVVAAAAVDAGAVFETETLINWQKLEPLI